MPSQHPGLALAFTFVAGAAIPGRFAWRLRSFKRIQKKQKISISSTSAAPVIPQAPKATAPGLPGSKAGASEL